MTDSDGATNSTFADVTVIKEVDYPPKANAGSNVIISLPQNSVTLYGNSSTDDKGIASYEWNKHEDILTADMQVGIGRSRWGHHQHNPPPNMDPTFLISTKVTISDISASLLCGWCSL